MRLVFRARSNHPLYQISKLERRPYRLSTYSLFNDPPRDLSRGPFLTVSIYYVCQLLLIDRAQQFCDCLPASVGVHPHIQRRIEPKTKSTRFTVKLERRNSQICEYSGRISLTGVCDDLSDLSK